MWKIWLIFLFLLLEETTVLSGTELNISNKRVFGTIDIDGALSNYELIESNKTFGAQLFIEKFYRKSKDFEFSYGVGVQVNENSKKNGADLPLIYSVPIYAGLKYNIFGEALYIKGKLGMPIKSNVEKINLNKENNLRYEIKERTKFFYGISIGLDYGIYEWEMAYTVDSIGISYKDNEKVNFDKINNIRVSIGYSKRI